MTKSLLSRILPSAAERAFREATALMVEEKYAPAAAILSRIVGTGHPEACFEFARLYESGRGVVADIVEAAHWYKIAADKGHAGAMARLGALLLVGASNPPGSDGQPTALYPYGMTLTPDHAAARAYATRSADAGSADGQALAGYIYAAGIGGPVDAQKSKSYYLPAAQAGSVEACLGLGTLYAGAHLGTPDHLEARHWLELASAKGNLSAIFFLGTHLLQGLGGPVDRAGAARRFTEAALRHHPGSMRQLGLMQMTRGDPLEDFASGMDWLGKAGRRGDSEAQRELAQRYRLGNGVRPDPRQALIWLERAAKSGDSTAQFELGVAFATGQGGVERDFVLASQWSEAAAQNGHTIAKINLGRFRMQGLGGDKDPADALKWLNAAMNDGELAALAALGELHAFWMNPPDHAEARRLLTRGASLGDPRCKDLLNKLPAEAASSAA